MNSSGSRPPHDDSAALEQIVELAHTVGLRLQANDDAISSGTTRAITDAIEELADPEMIPMLQASVHGNVEAVITMLADRTPPDQIPPLPAAIRYAVSLAGRNVSGSALRRAYHVGSDYLLSQIFAEVERIECEPEVRLPLFHHLARWSFQYIDHITLIVMDAYDEERRHTDQRFATTTAAYISGVLGEQAVDAKEFAAATGYRLDHVHIGALLWVDGASAAIDQADLLFAAANQLRTSIGSSQAPLVTAVDRRSARAWFSLRSDDTPVDIPAVTAILSPIPGLRAAFGAPSRGVEGFRATLRQAEHAAAIPRASDSPHGRVVAYSDEGIPVVARLAESIGATRQWVREILGDLALDSESAERERETVRVYLDSASSYVHTAERLMMHRNSIRYRLKRAEATLGRPLTEHSLDTQLALTVCHVLGSPVLTADQ